MSHPMHGKNSKATSTSGLSRKEKIVRLLEKEPNRQFTSTEIQEKLGFNTTHGIVIKDLNDLLMRGAIQSENITQPTGIKTVYYANV